MNGETVAGLHGATVHCPIALVLCSGALDAAALVLPAPARPGLHAAGYWTMALAALGTVPAVVSGLVLTHGVLLGHDALRLHHLFVWPAFAAIEAAAAWRLLGRDGTAARPAAAYLVAVAAAIVLVGAAGFTGGKLLLRAG
jgi:uncharacterized membrane protein